MLDFYSASIIIFVLVLAAIVYRDRKKFTREFIILLRKTQRGKGTIIRIGTSFPRFWKAVGVIGVVVGFVISVWIFYMFIAITAQNIMGGGGPGLSLVLPSASAESGGGPGYLSVPFWYWIIVIGLLALVHEGLHGIMAASQKIRIKSLGWGLLLIIPLAFVEPDEKQLQKMGSWVQLRVFAAGSFANFMLAGFAFLALSGMIYSLYVPAGVSFQGYPGGSVPVSDIVGVENFSVSSVNALENYLEGIEGGKVLAVATKDGEFYTRAEYLTEGAKKGIVPVYEKFDAVKVNLTGTITRVDGFNISNTNDLRASLEKTGPGRTITVAARDDSGNERLFRLTTGEEPQPKYRPDTNSVILLNIEAFVPGTVDFVNSLSSGWAALWGNAPEKNWQSIAREIAFWTYADENYPIMSGRAEEKINALRSEQDKYPRAGFLGIASVTTKYSLKEGLVGQKGLIEFLSGLLFWMFLINFGVGAFNLLPIRILDGGRMWEILLKKITRHYKALMRGLSLFTLLLLILNFAMAFGL